MQRKNLIYPLLITAELSVGWFSAQFLGFDIGSTIQFVCNYVALPLTLIVWLGNNHKSAGPGVNPKNILKLLLIAILIIAVLVIYIGSVYGLLKISGH